MPRTTSFDETEIAWTASGTGEPLLTDRGPRCRLGQLATPHPHPGPRSPSCVLRSRGTGDSAVGDTAGYTTRAFARDAVAVLDAAGIDRAHVYGHSMGGRVAQWLAIDAPHRVGALVLGATTAGDSQGSRPPLIADERGPGKRRPGPAGPHLLQRPRHRRAPHHSRPRQDTPPSTATALLRQPQPRHVGAARTDPRADARAARRPRRDHPVEQRRATGPRHPARDVSADSRRQPRLPPRNTPTR